jgi:hypothetical protein
MQVEADMKDYYNTKQQLRGMNDAAKEMYLPLATEVSKGDDKLHNTYVENGFPDKATKGRQTTDKQYELA